MSNDSILNRQYISSFTPDGKIEHSKECPECKKFLPATRFKGVSGKRNSIKGTIRNLKCRNCESKKTEDSKIEHMLRAEIAIDELTHRVESVQYENDSLRNKIKEYDAKHKAIEKILDAISNKLDMDFDEEGELIKIQISRFHSNKDVDI